MMKLTILQTHPIQYYAPLYRELSARDNVEVTVIYLTDSGAKEYFDPGFNRMVKWDIDLLAGYQSRIMRPGLELSNKGFFGRSNRNLLSILKTEKPDYILLYGYFSLMNWRAWWYAQRKGIKILYTSDSNARIDALGAGVKSYVKHALVKTFFSKVYRFLYPSEANAEYLIKYGALQERLIWSPFSIDVTFFTQPNSSLEREFDFIWIGKFIELKRCEDYLQALINLRNRGVAFRALLVGDGPCKGEILKVVDDLVEEGLLEIRGFVNQTVVPNVLSISKTLVFTSERESYGLVATESAASGCALVVANSIGCVGKLSSAQPNVNALIYEVGNVLELTNCMQKCLVDKDLVGSMQAASLKIATEHDVSKAAAIIESLTCELGVKIT